MGADSLVQDLLAVGDQSLEPAPLPMQEQELAPGLVQPQALARVLLECLAGVW